MDLAPERCFTTISKTYRLWKRERKEERERSREILEGQQ